ncbi:hypothetical protein NC796_00410 [Aliifodinibius sp. S!AR15-10]|uniref:AfsR/SARP family transcriptional regulator n=1 Tax=Aliifodinibius sp. S!AR15-10 TaxID=2950437 RepID=UPI002861D264|nr:BTAD domain-containing putative transcriptional regulator [Aliifodinibius sp. S!AR15-10]MDR8389575.1 hypothetical protein [Aliifodinibius sp. S!AR15-10]
MPEKLHINLFGGFCLKFNGEQIADLDSPRLQQILAYLILNRSSRQSRQYLAFQFWPDSSEKQALANLRNQLHLLRNVFPEAERYLIVDHKSLQWNTQVTSISDVAKFEVSVRQAKQVKKEKDTHQIKALKKAISLYKGPLLPEYYEDWIEHHRVRLKHAYESALQKLIELLENDRNFDEAIYYAKKFIQHDPLNETAWRWLMKLYASDNNRASALQTYRKCANVLKEEFDVRPSRDTTEVYKRLLSSSEEIDTKTIEQKINHGNQEKLIDQYQEETESLGSASEDVVEKTEKKFSPKKTENKIDYGLKEITS